MQAQQAAGGARGAAGGNPVSRGAYRTGEKAKLFFRKGRERTRNPSLSVDKEPGLGLLSPDCCRRGDAWGPVRRGSEVIRRKLPSAHGREIKELVVGVEGEAVSLGPLDQKPGDG